MGYIMTTQEREALILSLRRSNMFSEEICSNLSQTDDNQLQQFEFYRTKIQSVNLINRNKYYPKILPSYIELLNEKTFNNIDIVTMALDLIIYIALSGNNGLIAVCADYFYSSDQFLRDSKSVIFAQY